MWNPLPDAEMKVALSAELLSDEDVRINTGVLRGVEAERVSRVALGGSL